MEPTSEQVNYQRIEKAIAYLTSRHLEQPSLDALAASVHMSPFHFQRMFSEWAGISPKRFLQYLTVRHLKERIGDAPNLAVAADEGGLSSPSRVYDLFTTLEAVTPDEFRRKGGGLVIHHGIHDTPFGRILLGVTERGVCWLSFVDNETNSDAIGALASHWPGAVLVPAPSSTAPVAEMIFTPSVDRRLSVLVKGTNFQVKVWEALLRIPMGQLTTYQHIAAAIGQPRALQAVGSAVGANAIACLIPCHRVIRKTGIIGEYRWSTPRKKSMIGWELAHADAAPA